MSRQLSVPQFEAELEAAKAQGAVFHCTFLHNTAGLTTSWRGRVSIDAIDAFHRRRGFSRGLACHGYAAPDGSVWTARSFFDRNCACHAPTRGWSRLPVRLRTLINNTRGSLVWSSWPNRYGFGIETVGNYDVEDPTASRAMQTSLDVLAAVHRVWGIAVEDCYFHRDVAPTGCPGDNTKREWVHAELRRRLDVPGGDAVKVNLGRLPTPNIIDCNARLEEGVTRVDVRPLAEALGCAVHPNLKKQGKVYLAPTARRMMDLLEWMVPEERDRFLEALAEEADA